jgi:hypothetical protein
MRRVAEDPGLCRQIGDAARLRIEERFAPGVIGQLYRRRLETLALQELIPWTLR